MTVFFLNRRVVVLLSLVVAIPCGLADDPEFLKHTPGDRDTFFYIADPLPHLQSAVESVPFARLTDIVNSVAPSPIPDTETLLVQLNQSSAYLPTEIAVTTTGDEIGGIGRLFHVGVLVALCGGAIETEQTAELSGLQQALLKELQQVQFDSSDIWLNFRSSVPAAIVYGQVTGLAAVWNSAGIVEADFSDGIRLNLTAKPWLENELTALYFLREMGVIDDVDSAVAKALAGAVMKLEMTLHLRQHGNALRLTLGDGSAESETANADVFDGLVGPDQTLVVSGRYQLAALRQEMVRVNDLWDKWEGSEIGDAVEVWDTDDFLNDLGDIKEALKMAGDEGRFVVHADEGIRCQWTEFGIPAAPSLAETGLLKVLPETQEFLSASSMKSLGVSLSEMLAQFESRLATNSLKYELTGRQQQAAIAESVESYYYEKMAEFRRLIKVDAVDAFQAPIATMMDSNGSVSELHLTFQGKDGLNELMMQNLRCPRLAVIGGIQPGKDIRSVVGEIWKSFYNGVSQEDFDFEAIVEDADRLGHPAWFFTSDWQTSLPAEIRVSARGFEPHFFVIDDRWFVFSTSPDFSKEILKTSAASNQTSSIPGHLTGYGRVPMRTFADMVRTGTDALARLVAVDDNIVVTGQELQQFQQMLRAEQSQQRSVLSVLEFFSTLMEVVDQCRWESQITDQTCTTDFRIEFPEY